MEFNWRRTCQKYFHTKQRQYQAFSSWINTFLFPDGFPASENVNRVPMGTDEIRIPFCPDSALDTDYN